MNEAREIDATPMRAMLTPEILAQLLRVSPMTLKRWRRDGRGPQWIEIGAGRVRYLIDDVEEWTREHRPERPLFADEDPNIGSGR
jgi:predicted site-specific integrase-resolvase